jgi:hypothetical protein
MIFSNLHTPNSAAKARTSCLLHTTVARGPTVAVPRGLWISCHLADFMMAFPTSAPRSIKIKVGEKQVLELKKRKKKSTRKQSGNNKQQTTGKFTPTIPARS